MRATIPKLIHYWVKQASLCLVCTALLVATSSVSVAEEPSRLRVEGSTTLLPVVQALGRAFGRARKEIDVEIHGGGSSHGFATLLESDADLAASSRFISAEELARASREGVYLVPFRVAYGAIVPVVHKTNPLRSLSLDQLGQIYRGEVSNWKQLGGADRKIGRVSREPDSGTFQVWQQLVVGEEAQLTDVRTVTSSSAVVRRVADHRGAIGYIGLGHLNANVKPLRVNGVMGSLGNVRSGSYPLSRPLFLFTAGWPEGVVLDFINYALDPDRGQREVEEAGFIPLYQHGRH